ncbi:MAG TPA: transposase [Meiothermus sp.]|nr:transposase [Meiothermus sp.]
MKLHLLASNDQFICEVGLSPGATADVDGLYLLLLDLAEGSELYVDRGYTDYQAEDDLQAQGIQLRPIRKHNSKRYHQPSQFIAILYPRPQDH